MLDSFGLLSEIFCYLSSLKALLHPAPRLPLSKYKKAFVRTNILNRESYDSPK
jgi:hypothetical protein